MELCIDWYDTCLWVVGCKKPNPKINSYGIKSMESSICGWIHGLIESN